MSTVTSEHLNQTRRRLIEALGEKKHKYFHHMKQWFRMKRTEPVVTQVHQREHIPHTLQTTPTADRKQAKTKKRAKAYRPSHDVNFEPIYLHDIAPAASLKEPQAIMEAGPDYHSRSLCLLDMGPLKGRLLLAAWDHGLTHVGDQVAMVVQVAVQHCLKNILSLVISRRRGYRVREGRFIHSVGTTPANPWLRNSTGVSDWASESLGLPLGENSEGGDRPVWPTVDASDQNAAHLAACGPVGLQQDQPLLPSVSCFDLFHTLQIHRSVIPVHSVYGPCMERISSRLWHPGWGEVEQDAIVVQETLLKDTLREHRLAANTIT
ncbi:transcriptional adapter 1-like isoform X2 [Oratosquilla oratoria]|uniref:transcriptional adapter 1-like isoform X2 n=1 Tax=Oratosquilla oratoria TaxID=337810 RepID=UPI003F760D3A